MGQDWPVNNGRFQLATSTGYIAGFQPSTVVGGPHGCPRKLGNG